MPDQRQDETSKSQAPAADEGAGAGQSPASASDSVSKATLDPERWRRVAGVVEVALELDAATRAAYLGTLSQQDEALHRQVLRVLRSMGVVGSEDEPTRVDDPVAREVEDGRIGPWRVVRLLGRGGMGAVFLAERDDEEYERQVAVKVIGGGFQAPHVFRRFLAERQILATFDHPHIGKLFDGGTAADGRPYLVMEYVDGLPMDRYCFGRDLDIHDRLRLFRKICGAVAYAHRQLVVHRDLKSSSL
ncbi:MAG: protein kinase, partial [Acidobacteriota bacterium]